MKLLYLFCTILISICLSCGKEKVTGPDAHGLIAGSLTVTGLDNAKIDPDGEAGYVITVPAGTDIKTLKINIPVVLGATISPDPAHARDYSSPVVYTIAGSDGVKQTVVIKVVSGKSSEKKILAFSFAALSPVVQATIDGNAYKITAGVPNSTDLTKLIPTIGLSPKATISPSSGISQNFTNTVIYTVTAEDGSSQKYEVKVEKVNVANAVIVDIATGENHSLVLKSDGSLWGTGLNNLGQLGDIQFGNDAITRFNKIASGVKSIAAGGNSSFFIKTDNTLWATGENNYGQLGNGTKFYIRTPVKVMNDVKSVAVRDGHSLVIKTDNSLWVMGNNATGQLGDGTTSDRLTPVRITENVKAVAVGELSGAILRNVGFSLILKNDNSLWGTGLSVALGTNKQLLTPQKIMEEVKTIAAGVSHSLIIRSDNSLWGIGSNFSGELGVGSKNPAESPVKITDNVRIISAGSAYSAFVKTDNTMWGMGWSAEQGLFGKVSSSYDIITPIKIVDDVKMMSSSGNHTIIVKTDDTLWVMGNNDFGELGTGAQYFDESKFVKINLPQ